MYTGLLHLHNLLRWVILIALILTILNLFLKKDALKTSKVLLISAHSTLILGIFSKPKHCYVGILAMPGSVLLAWICF